MTEATYYRGARDEESTVTTMSIPLDQQVQAPSLGIFRTPSLDSAITSISNSLKNMNKGKAESMVEEDDGSVKDCPRTLSAENVLTASMQDYLLENPQSSSASNLPSPERWLPSSRATYNFHVGLLAHGERNRSQSPCSLTHEPDGHESPNDVVSAPNAKSSRNSDVAVWDLLLE